MTDSVGKHLTVWVDLCHTPQYNFYRNTITRLVQEGNRVLITVLDRGRLVKIVRSEIGSLPGVEIFVIGKHGMTKASAIWEANVVRNLKLFRWLRGRKIDVGLSNGYAVAFFGWLKGFRTYSFDDDPQTIDYRPKLWFNTECNFCLYKAEGLSPKAHILPVLKEWAYLAPGYFTPSVRELDKYGVSPKEYIFLREVTVGTVNYAGQESGAILGIKDLIPKGMKVLFSLEEKLRRDLYPADWILLQEPIGDIHSLIYYSAALVSSGDSMAREAALLGVPSYYLGIRYDMSANRSAAEVAGLCSRDKKSFKEWVEELPYGKEKGEEYQSKVRTIIAEKFIDINALILEKIFEQ